MMIHWLRSSLESHTSPKQDVVFAIENVQVSGSSPVDEVVIAEAGELVLEKKVDSEGNEVPHRVELWTLFFFPSLSLPSKNVRKSYEDLDLFLSPRLSKREIKSGQVSMLHKSLRHVSIVAIALGSSSVWSDWLDKFCVQWIESCWLIGSRRMTCCARSSPPKNKNKRRFWWSCFCFSLLAIHCFGFLIFISISDHPLSLSLDLWFGSGLVWMTVFDMLMTLIGDREAQAVKQSDQPSRAYDGTRIRWTTKMMRWKDWDWWIENERRCTPDLEERSTDWSLKPRTWVCTHTYSGQRRGLVSIDLGFWVKTWKKKKISMTV